MPMLIWKCGGAPPPGPGIAMSVVAATWFQRDTSLASVPVGGAADTLKTPSPPRSATTATGMNATDRLRDIVPLLVRPARVLFFGFQLHPVLPVQTTEVYTSAVKPASK